MNVRCNRLWLAACCSLLAGCGAILGIADGTPRDGGADATGDAVARDAGPDAALRCKPQQPFSTPVALAALDTGNDEAHARLTSDELTVVFERISGLNYDLYVASRPSATQVFDPPTALTSVDTPGLEADPSISGDGQMLFFATDREGGAGAYDIWTASRDDAGFGSLAPLSGVGSASNEQYPYALPNSLYFTSDRLGLSVIYRADLAGTTASNVTQVTPADGGTQFVPVVSSDELIMYFAAVGTSDASNDYDIWLQTRTATSQPWSVPVPVSELNTTAIDIPSWLSPDLCRLYMSTNRNGSFDIYLATRTP